jgi:hypothetical protein
VTVRRLAWTALVGLSLMGRPALAGEPAPINLPAGNGNQAQADVIAGQLRHSAVLCGYSVDVRVQGGDVELQGSVADQAQREEVLRLVQGVPGVVRVIDHLSVAGQGLALTRLQGPELPPKLPEPVPGGGSEKKDAAPSPAPPPGANGGAPLPEPVPLHRGAPGAFAELNPPRMPPYAWPTYAPYNNYSRVAYPQAYPWQSWPFIGPVYPFPKVPLGWRSVKLVWDDGYWWYGQVGNKYNWWKLRYW